LWLGVECDFRYSMEGKYRDVVHTTREIMWLKILMVELNFLKTSPMPMHCDNRATIYITNNPVFHIEVHCHFVRQEIV